jgi:hypothetical protein
MDELIRLNDLYARFNEAILKKDMIVAKTIGLEINHIHGRCMWNIAVAYGNLANSFDKLPPLEITN